MDLRAVVAPAEVAVEPGNIGRRLVAPAVIMQALCRHINRLVPRLGAILQGAADAAERAALHLGLRSLIGEAVLHLDVDGAAEGIETEYGVVGEDVRPLDGIG